MGSVDNRVVSMKFDNAVFEQKLAQTLGSIDKLKTNLDFNKSAEDIATLTKAGEGVNLDHLGSAAEGITAKFSAMSAIAFGALANIGSKAVEAGLTFAKSFAFGPIIDGFHEFETQMDSVQTILANTKSKGENVASVTKQLDVLNTYADQTIYNFSQMTSAVGKFTSAGIGLDKSVVTIKGFANWAATAGANAEQMAGASRQLAQALASGTVRLQDWISLESNDLGGEALQKSIIETARVHGVQVDKLIKKNGSFRESLSENWLTADIMTETLSKFTGDLTDAQLKTMGYTGEQIKGIQEMAVTANDAATKIKTFTQLITVMKEAIGSGWAKSFQLVLGDFEQGKELFTGLGNIFTGLISNISTAREVTLTWWSALGGREALIQSLRNILWALASVIGTIHKAFRDAFPRKTSTDLVNMTKNFEKFTHALIPSADTLQRLGRILGGVFSIFSAGWTIIKLVASAFKALIEPFVSIGGSGGGSALEFFAKMGDALKSLSDTINGKAAGIQEFLTNLNLNIHKFTDHIDIEGAIARIGDFFINLKNILTGINFGEVFNNIVSALSGAKDNIVEFFGKLGTIDVGSVFGQIVDKLAGAKDRVVEFFKNIGSQSPSQLIDGFVSGMKDFIPKALDSIKEFALSILTKIKDILGIHSPSTEFFDVAKNVVLGFIKGVLEFIPKALSAIGSFASALIDGLRSVDWSAVVGVITTALFGGLLYSLIGFVRQAKGTVGEVGKMFKGIGGTFKELKEAIKDYGKENISQQMERIAIALAILAASIFVLSRIDSTALGISLGALSLGLGAMVLAIKQLDGVGSSGTDFSAISIGFILMAAGLLLLSKAMTDLSKLNPTDLAKGVVALGVVLDFLTAALESFLKSMDKLEHTIDIKEMIAVSIGIFGLALGVKKLASSVEIFGAMDFWTLVRGLFGLSVVLLGLSELMKSLPNDVGKRVGGLLKMSIGLYIISRIIQDLGGLDIIQLVQGLAAITLVLGVLTIMMNELDNKDHEKAAKAIALIALSLLGLSFAVKILGEMDPLQLILGLGAITLLLIALTVAANAMDASLPGAAAMAIMAGSILLLGHAVKELAEVGFGSVMLVIIEIVALLIVLGLAMIGFGVIADALVLSGTIIALQLFAEVLLQIAVAAALFGLAALGIGAGAFLMVAALGALKDIGPDTIKWALENFPKLAAIGGQMLFEFIKGFLEGVPELISMLGTVLGAVFDILEEYVPRLAEIIIGVIQALLDVLAAKEQAMIDAGLTLLLAFLRGVRDNMFEITNLVVDIILNLTNALNDRVNDLINAGVTLLVNFLSGIAANIWKVYAVAGDIVVEIIRGLDGVVQKIIDAGGDLVIHFITGMGEKGTEILAAAVATAIMFLDGLSDSTIDFVSKAAKVLINFLNGMAEAVRQNSTQINDAAKNLIGALFDGMINALGLSEFVDKLKKGVEELASKLPEWMKKILGIQSPSKVFYAIGGQTVAGLTQAFDTDKTTEASIKRFGNSAVGHLNQALSGLETDVNGLLEFNPVISPVLDLTKLQESAGQMNKMLGKTPVLNSTLSFDQAASLSLSEKAVENIRTRENVQTKPEVVVRDIDARLTINSPDPVDTDSIYRNHKSQIANVKEELSV